MRSDSFASRGSWVESQGPNSRWTYLTLPQNPCQGNARKQNWALFVFRNNHNILGLLMSSNVSYETDGTRTNQDIHVFYRIIKIIMFTVLSQINPFHGFKSCSLTARIHNLLWSKPRYSKFLDFTTKILYAGIVSTMHATTPLMSFAMNVFL